MVGSGRELCDCCRQSSNKGVHKVNEVCKEIMANYHELLVLEFLLESFERMGSCRVLVLIGDIEPCGRHAIQIAVRNYLENPA